MLYEVIFSYALITLQEVYIYISENYYMRPERPVHQTLRTLKTLTANLDVASGDVAS